LAILEFVLKKKFEVFTSQSGKEALEMMSCNSTIDHVISDFYMPEMNGIEFIISAKKLFPNVNYHILTGFQENEEILAALHSDLIKNYFEKPFNTDQILNAIS
jgi:YesN/AraC family two-component response regulator